jgi:hypothetical protein
MRCPQCNSEWTGYGSSTLDPTLVILICSAHPGREQRFFIEPEQVMAFQLAMDSDALLDREISVIDGEPLPDFFRWPTSDARIGVVKNVNDRDYVVVSVDLNRVTVRPFDLP